jgi:hypothetical protein
MAHELRLMLLLSDEVDMARRRDAEVKVVREELGMRRERVEKEVRGLLSDKREAKIPEEKRKEEKERAVSPDSDEEEEMVELPELQEDIIPGEGGETSPLPDDRGGRSPIGEDEDDDFEEV